MDNHSTGRRVEHTAPASQRRPSAQKKPPRRTAATVGKVLGTLCLVGILTSVIFLWIFMTYVRTTLAPDLKINLDDFTMNLSSTILYEDKNGEWQELEKLFATENRTWVAYENIPKDAINAAIAIEDERFEKHHGVDWWRTGGAIFNMFFGMKNTYGGSTITQQVVKNVTDYREGTVKRKVTEIFRALELEKNYSKDDIMEVYLNKVYFGSTAYGIGAAADTYFGKTPQELSLAECASIIAITNNPSIYGPLHKNTISKKVGEDANGDAVYEEWTTVQWNKYRQELILGKMLKLGKISQEQHDQAVAEPLIFVGTPEYEALHRADSGEDGSEPEEAASSGTWSYFVDLVFEDVRRDLMDKFGYSGETATDLIYNAGYTIYATVDMDIQEIAESVYENVENLNVQNRKGEQLQSGITIMDPYTGDVVATVGGIGEKTGKRMGSFATAKRPCGSAIKPLSIYGPAIENNTITLADIYDDYPVSLSKNGARGYPKNDPSRYAGLITITSAVNRSVNTVPVRILEKLGQAASYDFMVNNLGFDLDPQDLAEAPLSMGGLTYGVSTLEMTAAYCAFINDGIYTEPRTYTQVIDSNGQVILDNTDNASRSRVAMKETTAYLVNYLLKNVVSSGTGTAARISGMTVAGKTGTTSNNYDRYFVGYTPYYCAAVWVGYGYNTEVRVQGGNPALKLWHKVMEQVHEGLEKKDFHTPAGGISTISVCTASGLLPGPGCSTQRVPIVSGTGPTETCNMHQTIEICTESGLPATEFCPAECRETRSFLTYTRQNLLIPDGTTSVDPETGAVTQNGTYILAEDNDSLLQTIQAKGTCPLHTNPFGPENPDGEDPENPNGTDPENPDGETPEQPVDPDSESGEPDPPSEPAEPNEESDLADWLNSLLP